MNKLQESVKEIYSLEKLSRGESCIHSLHPLSKLIVTFIYILCVVSYNKNNLLGLSFFVFYIVIIMSLAEIPYNMIFKRAAVALPFCVFAGLSNLYFTGIISFIVIILRTVLCVSGLLILIAVTPFTEITAQLKRLHLPHIFINLLEMTYRYITALAEEGSNITTAYALRCNGKKAIAMKDMGSFVGQLLLRSFDRAERVYNAMKCRGYGSSFSYIVKRYMKIKDYIFTILVSCILIVLRFFVGGF